MTKRHAGFWAFLLLVAGCGDSDDDSGRVASSKKIGDLTNEEAKQMCEDYVDDFANMEKSACTLEGLTAGTKELCVETRDACLENYESTEDDSSTDCEEADVSDVADCKVTVGELSSCLKKVLSYFDSLSCNKLEDSTLSKIMSDIPSCYASISADCPSIFGDEESNSSDESCSCNCTCSGRAKQVVGTISGVCTCSEMCEESGYSFLASDSGSCS
jgi:hypothetical protein